MSQTAEVWGRETFFWCGEAFRMLVKELFETIGDWIVFEVGYPEQSFWSTENVVYQKFKLLFSVEDNGCKVDRGQHQRRIFANALFASESKFCCSVCSSPHIPRLREKRSWVFSMRCFLQAPAQSWSASPTATPEYHKTSLKQNARPLSLSQQKGPPKNQIFLLVIWWRLHYYAYRPLVCRWITHVVLSPIVSPGRGLLCQSLLNKTFPQKSPFHLQI